MYTNKPRWLTKSAKRASNLKRRLFKEYIKDQNADRFSKNKFAEKKFANVGDNTSVGWMKTMTKIGLTHMLRVKIEGQRKLDLLTSMEILSVGMMKCVKSLTNISVVCLHMRI